MVKNNQIHKGTINWFGKASRISDIQHIDILITRKVRLVEEQLAYGAVLILYYRINSMNILKFFSSKEKYNSIITFTAL